MKVAFEPAPGLNLDDTAFAVRGDAAPGWFAADKVRFWDGRPQPIGGWELFSTTALTGVCRNIHPWNDNTPTLNVAFGTHSNLELWQGGSLYDITPTLALPSLTLKTDPMAVTSGSPNVVVTQTGHPYVVGDSIAISGAAAVGGITPNGTFAITAATTDTWTFAFTSNATGTATGGGSAVLVAPQRAFAAGAVDGTGSVGFGTGSYSTGTYSQAPTGAYYPRTWALANYGQTLIANPRGGPIYQWNNATGTPAAPLANSPAHVDFALVTPQRQVVAVGCNQSVSGLYDPMTLRGSDIEGATTWYPSTANNAWEQRLEGGNRLVAARVVGDYLFVWSDTCVWMAQFVGDLGQTYRFTRLGDKCGLIGPNAAVVVGQAVYWMTPEGAFLGCGVGGTPTPIPSAVQRATFANLAPSQNDKIVGAYIPAFREVWWFYPDARDGFEVSRYVSLGLAGAVWSAGRLARTAFHSGSPAAYPIGADFAGATYFHEKGQSANGAAIDWSAESGGQYLGEADQRVTVKGVWPDFKDQVGAVNLTLYLRDYPNSQERTKGPFALAATQSKRDFLADARIARVRLASSAVPSFCRLGHLEFEIDGSGLA